MLSRQGPVDLEAERRPSNRPALGKGLRQGQQVLPESAVGGEGAEEGVGCAAAVRPQLKQLSGFKAEARWQEDKAKSSRWCPRNRVQMGTTQGNHACHWPRGLQLNALWQVCPESTACSESAPGKTRAGSQAGSCHTAVLSQDCPFPIAFWLICPPNEEIQLRALV